MKKVIPKPVEDTTVRMSYETYAYLLSLIENQDEKLERQFLQSLNFIPHSKSGWSDFAYKKFTEEKQKLRVIQDELHVAASATYKDHPNKEMREFWGLKD